MTEGLTLDSQSQKTLRSGVDVQVTPFPQRKVDTIIAFDRHELQIIMGLYGRMVAAGEWRDYAMDFSRDKAVFSIYRRSSEMPLYRIIKDPELRLKQGMYSVLAPGGLILKRGQDLSQVMRVIDKPLQAVRA
ncbi:MAG: DUF2794 domain-containing protein [Beijerinckiaceae bacterium]